MKFLSWLKRKQPTIFKPLCGHIALYCGKILHDKGYRVQVWVGVRKGVSHAQASAFIDKKWRWLDMYGRNVIIVEEDRNFTAINVHPLENFRILWEPKWKD